LPGRLSRAEQIDVIEGAIGLDDLDGNAFLFGHPFNVLGDFEIRSLGRTCGDGESQRVTVNQQGEDQN
jgi:hypothetical protein